MANLPTFHADEFRKASRSSPQQECVEVARRGGWVVLRDDKNTDADAPDDPRLYFTEDQFDAWQVGFRTGNTDGLCLSVTQRESGQYVFRAAVPQPVDGVELVFDEDEVRRYYDAVQDHEFDAVKFASA